MIAENLSRIKKQIEASAAKSGRGAKDLTLVAITKNTPDEKVAELISLGQHHFGENKVQELERKAEHFNDLHWHLVGHLQTNKVNTAVKYAEYIHSVDSEKIAKKIDEVAGKSGKKQKIFVEVNVSGEESKYGISENELPELINQINKMKNIELLGLMTMAPLVEEQACRPCFRKLRQLAGKFGLKGLSMGMSNDYGVAVEEGATFVRIGTALFADKNNK